MRRLSALRGWVADRLSPISCRGAGAAASLGKSRLRLVDSADLVSDALPGADDSLEGSQCCADVRASAGAAAPLFFLSPIRFLVINRRLFPNLLTPPQGGSNVMEGGKLYGC